MPSETTRNLALSDNRPAGEHFLPLQRLEHQKYDIIHTHSGFHGPQFLAMQMTRRARQRYVHTLHSVSLDYFFACRAWFNWRCYYSTIIEAAWSRYANHVIAVSTRTRDWARKCFGINDEKISVIYNGFTPTPNGSQSRQRLRDRLGLTPENIALLFVGRGEDRVKGTDIVTAAMHQLYHTYSDLRLLAVPGAGFKPAPWLCATGPISHQHIAEYYAVADIFVNASLSEGMPLTIIEAMAAALPIVAAPVGGIAEVLTHNHTGLLLRPDRGDLAQNLGRLITDANLRQRLGANAKKAAAKLTWQDIAEQTLAVYESL